MTHKDYEKLTSKTRKTRDTWVIEETQNPWSRREGYEYTGTLSQAKRLASRRKFFQGTVLQIYDSTGSKVAVKEDGKWELNSAWL